jgi:metallo-beta-lactamase class B
MSPTLISIVRAAAVIILVGAVAFFATVMPGAMKNNRAVREARADPHRIAGNLYFIGTPVEATFLLTGSEGHVVFGVYPGATEKVTDNIEQLGFAVGDVRMLLASGPHAEESGGLAALQQASGAQLWASEANAPVLASGGRNDPSIVYTPHRLLAWAGVGTVDYPAPRVDHSVKDGETVRLGSLALTAHITPGHAPGCTTWTFVVRDAQRDLHVVYRCSLVPPFGGSLADPEKPAGVRADFERTFRTLRALPVDIWVSGKTLEYGRYRKYEASLTAEDPVAPFIDPKGYLESIDAAEAQVRGVRR